MSGALHIGPLLGFPPPREVLSVRVGYLPGRHCGEEHLPRLFDEIIFCSAFSSAFGMRCARALTNLNRSLKVQEPANQFYTHTMDTFNLTKYLEPDYCTHQRTLLQELKW